MKMMKPYLLYLLLFFSLNSCNPKETIQIQNNETAEPITNGILDIIWQVPLFADTSASNSITPIIHGDNVILSSRSYNSNKEFFHCINGKTGDNIWTWDDPNCTDIAHNGVIHNNNKIGLSTNRRVYVLDLDTGQKVWNSEETSGWPRVGQVDHSILWLTKSKSFKWDSCSLVSSNLDFQNWKNVFTLVKKNDYVPSIEPPASWINSNGETILIFQNRSHNFTVGDGKIDLYAYNLTQEKIEWVHEDITESGNSSVYQPIVHNDMVYFQGLKSLHCYNIETGDLVWERKFPEAGFLTCNMVLADDKLIANGDAANLWALNLDTGETIWNNTTIKSHNSGNMIYHKGIVYFTSEGNGTLCAVETSNGSTIWEEDSPNEDDNSTYFKGGVAINPTLNHLYVIDGAFAMCIKLPEK